MTRASNKSRRVKSCGLFRASARWRHDEFSRRDPRGAESHGNDLASDCGREQRVELVRARTREVGECPDLVVLAIALQTDGDAAVACRRRVDVSDGEVETPEVIDKRELRLVADFLTNLAAVVPQIDRARGATADVEPHDAGVGRSPDTFHDDALVAAESALLVLAKTLEEVVGVLDIHRADVVEVGVGWSDRVVDRTVNDSIAPANADLNNIGAMDVKDTNYLFQGLGEYEQGGFRGNKGIVVKGIWAPPNTRVVRLNISRGSASSIDLWNDRSKIREEVGDEAQLALVDDLGRLYFPIGYIHATATGDRRVTIRLQRDGQYYQIGTFPNLSSSGSDKLYALFTPAVGRKIVAVRLGASWVATTELVVPPPS